MAEPQLGYILQITSLSLSLNQVKEMQLMIRTKIKNKHQDHYICAQRHEIVNQSRNIS